MPIRTARHFFYQAFKTFTSLNVATYWGVPPQNARFGWTLFSCTITHSSKHSIHLLLTILSDHSRQPLVGVLKSGSRVIIFKLEWWVLFWKICTNLEFRLKLYDYHTCSFLAALPLRIVALESENAEYFYSGFRHNAKQMEYGPTTEAPAPLLCN